MNLDVGFGYYVRHDCYSAAQRTDRDPQYRKKLKINTVTWLMLDDNTHYAGLHTFEKSFRGRNFSSYDSTNLQSSSNICDYVLHVGLSLVYAHGSLFYVVISGSFVMLVLTMRQLGKTLETELKIGKNVLDIQKGMELYRRLKKKVDAFAQLYGNQILAFYITSLTYYAQAPHVFLGKRGNAEKLAMGYYTLNGVIWIVAAEFHKNVQVTVQKWIVYHTENVNSSIDDRLKLISLSNEMVADPVALACRYFYVTYQQFNSVGTVTQSLKAPRKCASMVNNTRHPSGEGIFLVPFNLV
ncbi:unnamed protein product [Orchesella dallaii]|uniref:Uncharacterized protein n=1 Tax=Orchesella dallaii TaxID=48710 RepID=A0ABP1QHN9_9HEXA